MILTWRMSWRQHFAYCCLLLLINFSLKEGCTCIPLHPPSLRTCTLSWYSHNGSESLMSNDIVVILLKGTHTLNSTIHIENHKNLTIIGESGYTLSLTCDQPVSWINCTSSEAGILFLNSRNILVMNLGLNSCGSIHSGTLDSDTGKLVNFNVSAALSLDWVTMSVSFEWSLTIHMVMG